MAACAELEATHEKAAALSYDALTHGELVSLLARREAIRRREPVIDHEIINRWAAEADPAALGATSLADLLATSLRISKNEARQRINEAEPLGPRRAMTGEPLLPRLPNVAAAQGRSAIGRSTRRWPRVSSTSCRRIFPPTCATRWSRTWPTWQAGWVRRSSVKPPTVWPIWRTRTSICPTMQSAPVVGT
jgi:hypothetical protein